MVTAHEKNQRQTIIDLALKYRYNEKHAANVEETSLAIFDSLKEIHKLGHAEKILLSHACLLHDIGSFINEKKHDRHTKYIIDKDELLSVYPERERNLISLIAYNHRKKVHKSSLILQKKDRDIVLKLSSILRIADSLCLDCEKASIKSICFEASSVKITVESINNEKILNRFMEKKNLFVDVFKLEISINM